MLQAHMGVGLLACQELVALGAEVTVQVPEDAEALKRVKTLGVKAVKVGSPLQVIGSLQEDSFDFIIDTVGGREIWQGCRRIFSAAGQVSTPFLRAQTRTDSKLLQFTTLVGDSHDAALSRNAHVKSNMRSLRNAFVKSDNKHINYEWVSPSAEVDQQGKGIRDTLEGVMQLALDGTLRPRVESVVLFERAPGLLTPNAASATLLEGGVSVVQLMD